MMKIPMPDGGIFAVIEPGNIERMKQGKPLLVGTSCVCFTPDMSAFLRALGIEDTSLPPRGQDRSHEGHWTSEQLEAALKACQKLPEVSYDVKCEELAKAFLDDEPELKSDPNIMSLAQAIQEAIEDWLEAHGAR